MCLRVIGIVAAFCVLLFPLVVAIIDGYLFNLRWTGVVPYTTPYPPGTQFQPEKTRWDWMELLFIPAALAFGGLLFTWVQKS